MSRLIRTYPLLTIWRIALLYVVLMLCRVAFVLYNTELLCPIAWSEVPALIEGAVRFDTVSIIYANCLWIVLSLLPFRFRENKIYSDILYWLYVVVNSIAVVAINMCDAVYFRYTQKRFTAEEIFFADNSNSVLLVFKFLAENWYLVLYAILLMVLLAKSYGRNIKPKPLLQGAAYYICSTILFFASITLAVGGVRGGFSRMVRPIAVPVSMQYATNSNKANIVLSNPFCILRTVSGEGISVPQYFEEDELNDIFSPCHAPAKTTNVSLANRNVVVFVMESLSAEHSAYLCPDIYADEEQKGYTPFLDSLMREGYTFSRMYANGKRSIQALPSIWSSIPSLKEPFMLMAEALGESRPLPRILSDKGYSTAFFCGSERGSMGFGAYANTAGFERNYSLEDYEQMCGKDDFDGFWGIWDDCFLSFMGRKIDEMKEPFMTSVFTISSHHPFVVPDKWQERLPEGKTKVQKCVAYTDAAVERFFEENSHKAWFPRTVFVFVADHVSSERFAPRSNVLPYDMHIVGFIYTPDGALKGEYDRIASQIDIMPTMMGLMQIDEPYFAYGRNLLDEQSEQCVVLYDNGYKAITNDYIYIFSNDSVSEIYALNDISRTHNLVGEVEKERVERYIKAFIQQYYGNAKEKNFRVGDCVSPSEPR